MRWLALLISLSLLLNNASDKGNTVGNHNKAPGVENVNFLTKGHIYDNFHTNTYEHKNSLANFPTESKTSHSIVSTNNFIMPGNNSFIKATIEGGGGTRSRRILSTDKKSPKKTDIAESGKKSKRNRKEAQLNSSGNESFTGKCNTKVVRKLKTEISEPSEEVSVEKKECENKMIDSPMSEEFDSDWLYGNLNMQVEEYQSVPTRESSADMEKALAASLGRIDSVSRNMHQLLRGELDELDSSTTLPSHNATLTPSTIDNEEEEEKNEISFFPLQAPEATTSQCKPPTIKFVSSELMNTFHFLVNPAPELVASNSRKRNWHSANQQLVFVPKANMNDGVRKILEARIQRDIDWPFKVGIFPEAYQSGAEKDMLTMAEKESIGKFIGTGVLKLEAQAVRSRTVSKIQVHDEIRLSAGMAVINCKDKPSADWIMRAIANIKSMTSVDIRADIDLKSALIKEAKPFKAYTIINTNKTDTWEVTKDWLAKKGADVEKLYRVNTRMERNLVFTAVDAKRVLHNIFEPGKRQKFYQTLATNISVKLTYGEDETSKFLTFHRQLDTVTHSSINSLQSSSWTASRSLSSLRRAGKRRRTSLTGTSPQTKRMTETIWKAKSACTKTVGRRPNSTERNNKSIESIRLSYYFMSTQTMFNVLLGSFHTEFKNTERRRRSHCSIMNYKFNLCNAFPLPNSNMKNKEQKIFKSSLLFEPDSDLYSEREAEGDYKYRKKEPYATNSARSTGPSMLALGAAAVGLGVSLLSSSESETESVTDPLATGVPKKSPFRFRQLNMGKRMAAYTNLNTIIEKDEIGKEIQIIFIQEPNKKAAISGGSIFKTSDKNIKNVRAAIYVKNNLINEGGCHLITELTDGDQVAVDISLNHPSGNKINIVLCSIYMPTDTSCNNMITVKMEKLLMHCKENKRELIIATDCNAYCERWGSKITNARGETLMDWIKDDLNIINVGNKSTFLPDPLNPNDRCSCIDITLATTNISRLLKNWVVLEEDSHSDHRWI